MRAPNDRDEHKDKFSAASERIQGWVFKHVGSGVNVLEPGQMDSLVEMAEKAIAEEDKEVDMIFARIDRELVVEEALTQKPLRRYGI
ncbi:hypothetical protein [Rhodopila sp.]|uniref:hypothetical protein n=1 Tax=Rhodopila sp. TaxID=2480087 RepID=UPI003D0A2DC0